MSGRTITLAHSLRGHASQTRHGERPPPWCPAVRRGRWWISCAHVSQHPQVRYPLPVAPAVHQLARTLPRARDTRRSPVARRVLRPPHTAETRLPGRPALRRWAGAPHLSGCGARPRRPVQSCRHHRFRCPQWVRCRGDGHPQRCRDFALGRSVQRGHLPRFRTAAAPGTPSAQAYAVASSRSPSEKTPTRLPPLMVIRFPPSMVVSALMLLVPVTVIVVGLAPQLKVTDHGGTSSTTGAGPLDSRAVSALAIDATTYGLGPVLPQGPTSLQVSPPSVLLLQRVRPEHRRSYQRPRRPPPQLGRGRQPRQGPRQQRRR